MCGRDLFVRARQGLSPTAVAQEMYPTVKRALDAQSATLSEASDFDASTSRRRFRISIPHQMRPFCAFGLRAAVATASPGITLTFDTRSMPVDLEEKLREGAVDIALDWFTAKLDPFVNQKVFGQLILLVRCDHPTVGELRTAEFVASHRRREVERFPTQFLRARVPRRGANIPIEHGDADAETSRDPGRSASGRTNAGPCLHGLALV